MYIHATVQFDDTTQFDSPIQFDNSIRFGNSERCTAARHAAARASVCHIANLIESSN